MADDADTYLRFDTVAPEALEGKFNRNRHLLPAFATGETEMAEWPEPEAAEARNRAQGCLLGLAIGEAIGSAAEYLPRDSFDPLEGMSGGGPLNLAPGEWTDGTAMALCLAHSLLDSETVDQFDFMSRLQAWLEDGENACQGHCVAVGDTTRAAIEEFIEEDEPSAGSSAADTAGNGSLIRLAPLAIFGRTYGEMVFFLAGKQSRSTHATIECLDACDLLMAQLIDALSGADRDTALRPHIRQFSPNTLAINGGEWREKSREDVRSSGYVIDTLDAAIWAVGTSYDFEDAVLKAANLGGDPASVACVAGQLAGAIYGRSGIPGEWQETVAWAPRLIELADRLAEAGPAAI